MFVSNVVAGPTKYVDPETRLTLQKLQIFFTIHPGHHHTLPEGLPKQSNPTRWVIVKQLEHIHPSLYRETMLPKIHPGNIMWWYELYWSITYFTMGLRRTSVTMERSIVKQVKQHIATTTSRRREPMNVFGGSMSIIPVIKPSTPTNWERKRDNRKMSLF